MAENKQKVIVVLRALIRFSTLVITATMRARFIYLMLILAIIGFMRNEATCQSISPKNKSPVGKLTNSFLREYGRHVNRSTLWERGGKNVLWGFRNMYQFEIVHDMKDNYFPFKAWFFGWSVKDTNPGYPGCDAIFAARSKTLESGWEVYMGDDRWDSTMNPHLWVPVVTARNFYFDEWHNGDPSVVKVGKSFFMAYSSTGFNKDRKQWTNPDDSDSEFYCIMGAVSKDGIHWRRSKEPILANPNDFGAPAKGDGAGRLYGSYARPSLLYEDGKFKMWFDYWAGQYSGVTMGYAENDGDFLNPKHWQIVRGGKLPCLPQYPNPDVVRVDDVYFAYADPSGYDKHKWVGRKIVESVSINGLDWVVLGYVDHDPDSAANHVPQAFVLREKGEVWIYVFYACQVGGRPYDYRYNRIRYMRRRVSSDELDFYRNICRKAGADLKR